VDDSKILITGANGQLGQALQAKYPNARKADISELDITDKSSVLGYDWTGIEVILNAAAFTNVDGAETSEGRVAAWKVNATAMSYLAEVARKNNITLVHISTDYVFDGTQSAHKEEEPFSPLSVYGASKAAGDVAAVSADKYYILRTSWVIGEGKNFVRTMLELGSRGIAPSVVHDQIGRLTFTNQLVATIDYLLTTKAPHGIYNVSNSGDVVSWADITREIFKLAGYTQAVTDTTTAEYYKGKEGIAPRPLNSELDLTKIQSSGLSLRDWREDLKEYIKKELSK
jgi:dTDP-4-dehydrorhamnose 3,5-epimerase